MPPPPDRIDLAGNPGLRVALVTARAWGVSPSAFLGEPRRVVTEHEYDDTGRLVRAVTLEAGWTDDDRDLAYALAEYEAEACPGCGGHLPETTLREHEYAYVPDAERAAMCHRCVGQAAAGKPYEKHSQAHAILVPLRLDEGRVAANLARLDQEEAAARGHHHPAGA